MHVDGRASKRRDVAVVYLKAEVRYEDPDGVRDGASVRVRSSEAKSRDAHTVAAGHEQAAESQRIRVHERAA